MRLRLGENLRPPTRTRSRSSYTGWAPHWGSRVTLGNPPTRPETCAGEPSGPRYCRCQRCRRWYARHCPSSCPVLRCKKQLHSSPTADVTANLANLGLTAVTSCQEAGGARGGNSDTDLCVSIQHLHSFGGDEEVDLGHHLGVFVLALQNSTVVLLCCDAMNVNENNSSTVW